MTEPTPPPVKGLSLPVRRVIACVGIVVFLIFYVALISNIGQALPDNQVIRMLFYGLAGILWGIPVLPIISWSENYKKRPKS
ncbi:DUF2842 domain-containing protein [Asticcacaulis tiandongensis]|uniref:DUF2842 domain-containing protein n=1 Tax=Asticcacaulis tiandongensis TaxID=2565365 RepID=UPI00112C93E8|nr:DUF2842 domain-containing protein [Asticcacaulis tiandongensis]